MGHIIGDDHEAFSEPEAEPLSDTLQALCSAPVFCFACSVLPLMRYYCCYLIYIFNIKLNITYSITYYTFKYICKHRVPRTALSCPQILNNYLKIKKKSSPEDIFIDFRERGRGRGEEERNADLRETY